MKNMKSNPTKQHSGHSCGIYAKDSILHSWQPPARVALCASHETPARIVDDVGASLPFVFTRSLLEDILLAVHRKNAIFKCALPVGVC